MSTDMTPDELHHYALELLYQTSNVIGIIPHSIFYGIHLTLILFTSWMMLKRGMKTRIRRLLFKLTLLMFGYATIYMAVSIMNVIVFIKGYFLDVEARGSPAYEVLKMFSAIGLINYVLTDGIVVWRAWVLCKEECRIILISCLVVFGLATVSAVATVGIRIALYFPSPSSLAFQQLTRAINTTQVCNVGFSLIMNIMTVCVVAWKAWRYRRQFTDVQDSTSRTSNILALIVESGILYCLSLTIAVVAMFIHLPTAMLGDLYTPVNIQIAGIYPVMVLLLIDQENSLDQTIFSASTASTAGRSSSTSGPTVCHSKLDSSLTSIQLGPGASNNHSERTLTGTKSDGLTPIMED